MSIVYCSRLSTAFIVYLLSNVYCSTAYPDFMASMEENTVTLPNENTEEEPVAPVGGRSETGKARRPGIVFWLNLPN